MSESSAPPPITPDELRQIARTAEDEVRRLRVQVERQRARVERLEAALFYLSEKLPGSMPDRPSHVTRSMFAILYADGMAMPSPWGRDFASKDQISLELH